jgi:ABC-type branched-subunit amino acid transport system substrate-binding protein
LLAACGAKVNAPPEPPQAVRRGDEAYRYRDYETAILQYNSHTDLIDKDEYTARALYKAAVSQFHLGRYREALVSLDDLHRRYPDGRWVQVDALRGDVERALAHPSAAIESWDHGWQVASDNDRSKLRLRIATVARGMNSVDLAKARQSAVSGDVQELLEDQIAKRATPEINEPLPELEAPAEPEGELLAANAARQQPPPVTAKTPELGKKAGQKKAAAAKAVAEPAAEATAAATAPESATLEPAAKQAVAAAATGSAETPVAKAPAIDPNAKTAAARVAVLMPMTGLDASAGERSLRAVRLALEPNQLVVKDSQDHPAAAVRAFEELAADSTVLAVIGPLDRETAKVLAAKAAVAHLPLITLSPTEETSPPYVVQAGTTRQQLLDKLLDYAVRRARLRRFGVVFPDDPQGQAFLAAFKAQVDRRGSTIVGADGYSPDAKSLTAGMVHRWRDDQNLQALVLSDTATAAAKFAKFLQREMPDIPLLGINSWDTLVETDPALGGVVFASVFSPNSARAAVRDFVLRYEHTYGQTPNAAEAEAYDAALLVKHALNAAEHSRAAVWETLRSTTDIEGATGQLAVTPKGVRHEAAVLQLLSGKLVEIDAGAAAPAPSM